jgi:hypothetical protein
MAGANVAWNSASGSWNAWVGKWDDLDFTPGVGTLTLTGYAVSDAEGVFKSPAVASLILGGLVPSSDVVFKDVPGTASLTLTGFVPAVYDPSENILISPGVGVVTIVANDWDGYVGTWDAATSTWDSIGYEPHASQTFSFNIATGVLTLIPLAPSRAEKAPKFLPPIYIT